jgi:hypothetical protein
MRNFNGSLLHPQSRGPSGLPSPWLNTVELTRSGGHGDLPPNRTICWGKPSPHKALRGDRSHGFGGLAGHDRVSGPRLQHCWALRVAARPLSSRAVRQAWLTDVIVTSTQPHQALWGTASACRTASRACHNRQRRHSALGMLTHPTGLELAHQFIASPQAAPRKVGKDQATCRSPKLSVGQQTKPRIAAVGEGPLRNEFHPSRARAPAPSPEAETQRAPR